MNVGVLRLVVQGVAVTLTVIGLERLLSGVVAESTQALVAGAAFLGLLNAGVRPVFRVVSWPVALFPMLVVLLTLNGIAIAVVQPISLDWAIRFWHGVLSVLVVTGVSWGVSMAGVDPHKPAV